MIYLWVFGVVMATILGALYLWISIDLALDRDIRREAKLIRTLGEHDE